MSTWAFNPLLPLPVLPRAELPSVPIGAAMTFSGCADAAGRGLVVPGGLAATREGDCPGDTQRWPRSPGVRRRCSQVCGPLAPSHLRRENLPEARRALRVGCHHLESTPLCRPGFTDGLADAEPPAAERAFLLPGVQGASSSVLPAHGTVRWRRGLLGRGLDSFGDVRQLPSASVRGPEHRVAVSVQVAETHRRPAVLCLSAISLPRRRGSSRTVSSCLQ